MRSTALNITEPQDGACFSVVGDTYRLLITGAQTGGKFAVIDMLIPPQGGPGPHAHAQMEESFYVIAGEIVVRSEKQTYIAREGSFVHIPLGGTIHNFKNESDTNAHLLCTVTPAGLEEMFREIGTPVEPGQFLPPPYLLPDDIERMKKIAEKYGQELFPPDYFKS